MEHIGQFVSKCALGWKIETKYLWDLDEDVELIYCGAYCGTG